ncbi:MAG: hypothetical protein WDN06_06000 [Asticcacaulis sp.]
MSSSPASATPQRVQNTATIAFTQEGTPQSVSSNTTVFDFDRVQWPTTLVFWQMPGGFDYSGLTCEPGPPAATHGAPISAAQLATMHEDDGSTDQTLGIVLTDTAGNRNRMCARPRPSMPACRPASRAC